jgi:hypothetical protein
MCIFVGTRALRGLPLQSNSKRRSEHGPAAFRFLSRRLVLQWIPVLSENLVVDANDVGGD